MTTVIYQVDSFTDRPFAGNPAGVFISREKAREEDWMRSVAREMNLSETAFVNLREGADYDLRWFTPSVEVDLCGHATLAAAHVLWQQGWLRLDETVRFHTNSGVLSARRDGDWIELNFPATPAQPAEAPAALLQGLGVSTRYVGRSLFDYLVEVESEDVVRGLAPDMGLLASVGGRGVMVTSRSSHPNFDFVSRFFGPAAGIPEDPVTGSAHCCLGPYWGERLGKTEMLAYQASARGGVLKVRLAGPSSEGRVLLGGQAVTVMKCELFE